MTRKFSEPFGNQSGSEITLDYNRSHIGLDKTLDTTQFNGDITISKYI
jgi:hypothetical protein